MYDGPDPCLIMNDFSTFDDLLKDCVVVGGLNREFIDFIIFHSNEYAKASIETNISFVGKP